MPRGDRSHATTLRGVNTELVSLEIFEVFLPLIETVSVARVQNAELERGERRAGLKVSSKASPF